MIIKYQKYEFCRDIKCSFFEQEVCSRKGLKCTESARTFHNWYEDKGYELLKIECIGYDNIRNGMRVKIKDEEPYSNNHFSTDYDWEFIGIVMMVDCQWAVMDGDACYIPFCDIINSDMEVEILEDSYDFVKNERNEGKAEKGN